MVASRTLRLLERMAVVGRFTGIGFLASAGAAAAALAVLVVLIWPLRRFSAERATLAEAYRSLARYAASVERSRLYVDAV